MQPQSLLGAVGEGDQVSPFLGEARLGPPKCRASPGARCAAGCARPQLCRPRHAERRCLEHCRSGGTIHHLSGCRNPVTLCSILSSLSPSLSRTFRDAGFFFRGIHVSEIHFRELSRKTCDTNSPFSAVKCALKPLIPSTTGIVLQQLSLWQHVD